MSLASGTRLGPYEIVAPIGAGGMGEVYKARDTRLERTVAIKVLPPGFAADHERRVRFEREAKAVAALSHPHICTLHDVGESDGSLYLVMEHLAGETLAERLRKGPLPLDQGLAIAIAIAGALAAAHRQGVIHRDLKPGNVMLARSGVTAQSAVQPKLLDFGLAKLNMPSTVAEVTMTAVPVHEPMTGIGMVVGTVPYMAPEQLEGKEVDARSDIFAFGAVLYEMLTGRRAFDGESQASVIAAVLEHDPPPLSAVQPITPPALERLVRKCLQKDPGARWQTVADLADELRWLADGGVPANAGPAVSTARRGSARWQVAGLVLGGLLVGGASGGLAWRWISSARAVAPGVARLQFWLAGTGLSEPLYPSISPDGTRIVIRATDGKRWQLYVRTLDDPELKPLPGTEDVLASSFSPDGSSIAFVQNVATEDSSPGSPTSARLLKVSVRGGQPVPIIPQGKPMDSRVTWDADGRILFCYQDAPGVYRVSTAGGTPELLVPGEEQGSPVRHHSPQLIAAEQVVLYTAMRGQTSSIEAFSIRTKRRATAVQDGANGRFIPATGHLVYASAGNLVAVRFNVRELKPEGEPQSLGERGHAAAVAPTFDVSGNGTLVYTPPRSTAVWWRDRSGREMEIPVNVADYRVHTVSLSRDGQQAILTLAQARDVQLHRVILDGGEVAVNRLTEGNQDWFATFTCDGKRLLYTAEVPEGGANIFSIELGRSGKAVQQTTSPSKQKATSFGPCPSKDVFLYNDARAKKTDVWEQRIDRPETARAILSTPANEQEAVFSPDGRWIAYTSNATMNKDQVYVRAYPDGSPVVVSADGGANPVWNPRGGELFYQLTNSLYAVRIENGRRVGAPIRLFDRPAGNPQRNWDVAPDGQRFIMAGYARTQYVNVVLNWFEELKAKVR